MSEPANHGTVQYHAVRKTSIAPNPGETEQQCIKAKGLCNLQFVYNIKSTTDE